MLNEVKGGVCAAKGFKAAGVHAGVKKNSNPDKNDLALILSEKECTAAATYTLNRVKAAPVYVTMEHLENGVAWGVVANSGNANACCPMSHENAVAMAQAAAKLTGHSAEDFAVASTGVIGQTINIGAIEAALPTAAGKLERSEAASDSAARAIMTTDTVKKEVAFSCEIGGKTVTVGGIAKGSGMIHPNMGTMLCFVTTDCAITHEMLEDALRDIVQKSFNRVTVDGDTSTNDTCVVLANGMAGNELIEWKNEDYDKFYEMLSALCKTMAKKIAADGEGASRLLTCVVKNARSEECAERLSKAVVGSSLVKAAMFGADANWGRIICAMGYSKAPFRPEYVDIGFASAAGEILVCKQGAAVAFDEEQAKKILTQSEITIDINVNEGEDSAECWGCDLTYDYVKINGDYRT